MSFQSTLPARGATKFRPSALRQEISIHAPRTGSDSRYRCLFRKAAHHFNPRSPHGERPFYNLDHDTAFENFNPRSPHGERLVNSKEMKAFVEISIHAPRTGSDDRFLRQGRVRTISIHAPRTGSDMRFPPQNSRKCGFQSTLPARGATVWQCVRRVDYCISIHAPRTGSDINGFDAETTGFISIHAPRTGSDSI